MSILRDILCLLAILVAYGIVGRIDRDDAVMKEEALRGASERPAVDCDAEPLGSAPAPQALTRRVAVETPGDSASCWHGPYPVAFE